MISQVASINGVALHTINDALTPDELRQRACTELLRQEAQRNDLLAGDDMPATDGIISEAAAEAIEALLEKILNVSEPSEEACRRHYAAHQASYSTGEKIHARHILFAVTPGVNVVALRKRAEEVLIDVRSRDDRDSIAFAQAAREFSNCPSGAQGGDLGWLTHRECAPEFAKELFGHNEVGVLPRLVHSRFGLHVVEVLQRELGVSQPYESVRGAVTMALRQQSYATALHQYLLTLAGQARMESVELATGNIA